VVMVKDMIQSKFLRKEDFDEDRIMTIRGVRLEDMPADARSEANQKWVLYFREEQKGMALSITTIRVLEQAYGPDSDHWIGNRVMVYVDPNVSFAGKIVGGLRLRTPRVKTVQRPAAPAARPTPRQPAAQPRPAAPPVQRAPDPTFDDPMTPAQDEFSPEPAAAHEFDDDIPFS
jgi:hypothetical protein